MEITSQHAESKGIFSRQHMEKGFLLNWIDLQSTDIPPGYLKFSIAIETYLTDPAATFSNQAAVPASGTAHRIIAYRFVQFPFYGQLIEALG
jgi:hypothetical protein